MADMRNAPQADDCLNILEQMPGLSKLYTQICLCYSVADASSHTAIIATLTNGLERLAASFPWVAGQVVNEGASEGNTGTFKIGPLEKIPRLIVKDYTQDPSVPNMDAFRQANFPFRMLDESIIAPRSTLHLSPTEPDDWPVFLLQANFIEGGLLLTFLGHHITMDMTGQGHIMHLLSKACSSQPFTADDISSGNMSRLNLVSLLQDSYQPGKELANQLVSPYPPQPDQTSSTPAAPPASWAYFTFSQASLSALKTVATNTITPPVEFISTDDALSALVWSSIVRARLPRLEDTATSSFARAVDMRRLLGISPTYPGLLQTMAFSSSAVKSLAAAPLGAVASQLRAAVDPKTSDLGYQTQALATVLSRAADKNCVSLIASLEPSSDVMLSSWSKVNCYELDFGLHLGKPESVRRPHFLPVESLVYFMPKALNGEITVGICLRDEDLERLKADAEFTKFGIFVG